MAVGRLKRDRTSEPGGDAKPSVTDAGTIDAGVIDAGVIDADVAAALHVRHAEELRYFIVGVVRDHHLAAEVVQATFVKVIEQGHTVKQESLKAWLFRVAYNEALAVRRRQAVGDKANRYLAENLRPDESGPETGASQGETVAAVRAALKELPAEQRQVVALRIYEQKRFVEIAEQLKLPLGTVLSRMQLALQKLRKSLKGHEE